MKHQLISRATSLLAMAAFAAAVGLVPLRASAGAKAPVNVGFLYSKTGLLASA